MRATALIADSILVYDGKVDLSQVSAVTHENFSRQLLRERKFEQALVEAGTAIEVAPNRPAAHVTRSAVLLAMGRSGEARDEIRKADTIADSIPEPH
jgi:Flp pilus assembly protein TadD